MVTDDNQKFTTVDEYIEAATYDVEPRLVETRGVIRAALPDAEETISYNIPAYKQDGIVVIQFAGHTEHTSLNFFPTAATFAHFAEELAPFRTSKSAIQFPLDNPCRSTSSRRSPDSAPKRPPPTPLARRPAADRTGGLAVATGCRQ